MVVISAYYSNQKKKKKLQLGLEKKKIYINNGKINRFINKYKYFFYII